MATAPEQNAPGAEENHELSDDPQPGQAPADGGVGEEGGDDGEPGPYDALARDLGWVPKADYQGDPAQWRDAETFIRTGRDIQRDTARELKTLRSTIDNLGRTTAQVIEQETARRVQELSRAHDAAVEEGDSKRAFEIGQEIIRAKSTATAPAGIPPETQAFAERNSAWFKPTPQSPGGDPLATARAVELSATFAAQGYDRTTQLDLVERAIKREFPQHFGPRMNGNGSGKPAPGVHQPSGRGPQNKAGPKGFADMPAESQKVANDMASRVGGSDPEAFKKRFAENYWLQAGGKA